MDRCFRELFQKHFAQGIHHVTLLVGTGVFGTTVAVETADVADADGVGVLTYCAAMNDGEKAVTKAIRNAGYPLVVMMLDGFPPEGSEAAKYYHPGGIYHKACGEGRLYLMAPLADNYNDLRLIERTDAAINAKDAAKGYAYRPLPHDSTRWRMIAGNVMLEMIGEAE